MASDIRITLPTLHSGQVRIWNTRTRRNRVRCGRRWGKTKMLVTLAADTLLKRQMCGIFTPQHKQWLEPYAELKSILAPLGIETNKSDGTIRWSVDGKVLGGIDLWSTDDNDLAGRGREYHRVLMDETAFGKNKAGTGGVGLIDVWKKAIAPTMITTRGEAWAFSTPNGINPDNFFYTCCDDPTLGPFTDFHAPSQDNPYVPPDELERERKSNDPLVVLQEYDAQFVDWSGVQFFKRDKLLVDGQGVPMPSKCDAVLAIIDTAIKTGKKNDGTAVVFLAVNIHHGIPLVVLDWDTEQIEGASLEAWLPSVYTRLDELAALCGARNGSLGAFIEDKGSGTILLQQATKRGWPAQPIAGELTAMGKDERAISVSGYVFREMVKLTQYAFDKVKQYKGQTRNHFLQQVTTFRIGDPDPLRADDLTDCFTYGISLTLGDSRGY